eukprot:959343-Prymnesium_polylepis.1
MPHPRPCATRALHTSMLRTSMLHTSMLHTHIPMPPPQAPSVSTEMQTGRRIWSGRPAFAPRFARVGLSRWCFAPLGRGCEATGRRGSAAALVASAC